MIMLLSIQNDKKKKHVLSCNVVESTIGFDIDIILFDLIMIELKKIKR
jgi:hypothetical protein